MDTVGWGNVGSTDDLGYDGRALMRVYRRNLGRNSYARLEIDSSVLGGLFVLFIRRLSCQALVDVVTYIDTRL